MNSIFTRSFLFYTLRFLGLFILFYIGSLLVIGLSTKENMYSPLVANYFDFITPLRDSILTTAGFLLRFASFPTQRIDEMTLVITGGRSIRMVYSCVGYGVMSFWAAFVIANRGDVVSKLKWLFGGWVALWFLNVIRVIALLLAIRKKPATEMMPLDHHTIYNIISYLFIFGMVYFYDHIRKHQDAQSQLL